MHVVQIRPPIKKRIISNTSVLRGTLISCWFQTIKSTAYLATDDTSGYRDICIVLI